jgi:DMSO/TMAO reductase YedYZ molybdopterin-dependent catalytic subunit
MYGAPLRLVVPGWPGSCSQKWLTRVYLRDKIHDGPKMTGTAYRVPNHPVSPGQKVPKKDFGIIQAMPVKSLITSPETGGKLSGRSMIVHGHAWAGDNAVDRVDISHDFGATWMKADLSRAANAYAWQNFSAKVSFPKAGYYEIWARATDDQGRSQPFAIAWNPKGYLNNSMHRISVRVA